ncbi:MAG TPA: hypothetical protein VMW69_06770, partial [Spirochaetia bacterium]|nr:hypothetical protein [Spirochaetia bacterium]
MNTSQFAPLQRRRDELVEVFGAVLSANVFANRFIFHPQDLPAVAEEAAECFLAFVDAEDSQTVRALGDSLERRGLGDVSEVALLLKLQQFCAALPLEDEPGLRQELQGAVERFANALVSGFAEAREEEIISEQEQLRHALSAAIESQSRELLEKNHAIATSISAIVLADLAGRITYA